MQEPAIILGAESGLPKTKKPPAKRRLSSFEKSSGYSTEKMVSSSSGLKETVSKLKSMT